LIFSELYRLSIPIRFIRFAFSIFCTGNNKNIQRQQATSNKMMKIAALATTLASVSFAYPSSFSGDVTSQTAGGSFGSMSIANYESVENTGTKCTITHDVPGTGYAPGNTYSITVSTTVAGNLGMVWKVSREMDTNGGMVDGTQGNSGTARVPSKVIAWSASNDASVTVHAICGASGA
jgi:hypothetical protein